MRLHAYIPIWCTMLLSCVATPPTVRTAPLALPGLPLPSRGLPAAGLIRSDIPARVIDLEMTARYTPGSTRVSAVHHVTLPVLDHPSQILLSVSARGQQDVRLSRHQNGLDQYLGLSFRLTDSNPLVITTVFRILVIPLDYSALMGNSLRPHERAAAAQWLRPSQYIESDHPLISALAGDIRKQNFDPLMIARAAWAWPSRHLRFAPQTQARGAVYAAQHKTGDCTEYAALTTALCRAAGIPARMTAVFSLGDKDTRDFALPNHSALEAFLPDRQGNGVWLPLDPNLSLGRMESTHGFGKTDNTIIRLKREGAWTWGNSIPKNIRSQPGFGVSVTWQARVIDEGPAADLFARHQR